MEIVSTGVEFRPEMVALKECELGPILGLIIVRTIGFFALRQASLP